MQKILSLFVIVLIGMLCTSALGVGSWESITLPSDDAGLYSAAEFAAESTVPGHLGLKIISAEKQVVAGINYRIHAEVLHTEPACTKYDFQVYNRFGSLALTSADAVFGACSTTAAK